MKMTLPDTQNYVNAFDGSIKEVESPNQGSMDRYWDKVTSQQAFIVPPSPVYNIQAAPVSNAQKFFIFFAAVGVGYLILKQIKRG